MDLSVILSVFYAPCLLFLMILARNVDFFKLGFIAQSVVSYTADPGVTCLNLSLATYLYGD